MSDYKAKYADKMVLNTVKKAVKTSVRHKNKTSKEKRAERGALVKRTDKMEEFIYSLSPDCICKSATQHEMSTVMKDLRSHLLVKSTVQRELLRVCERILELKEIEMLRSDELHFLHQMVYIAEVRRYSTKRSCGAVDTCEHQDRVAALELGINSTRNKLRELHRL